MKQNMVILTSVLSLLIVATVTIPSSAFATPLYNTVVVDGNVWSTTFLVGQNVCEAVKQEKGTCFYVKYNPLTKTHYVETQVNAAQADRLIVKDVKEKVLADFIVPAGTNHRTAVADKLKVNRDNVIWMSGDTQPNKEYQYEAILLVLDPIPAPVVKQDRLIVKNVKKEVIADFYVNPGVDHITAVANQLKISPQAVEWLSGDTQVNKPYGYEAILLVR